eukprot:scaffold173695_cov35-Prasinocladus_malaysianus.AAC.1
MRGPTIEWGSEHSNLMTDGVVGVMLMVPTRYIRLATRWRPGARDISRSRQIAEIFRRASYGFRNL